MTNPKHYTPPTDDYETAAAHLPKVLNAIAAEINHIARDKGF